MRDNSKKVLLYLFSGYRRGSRAGLIPLKEIKLVLSDLSPGGTRSLLHVLEKKKLLVKESISGKSYCRLTAGGEQELKANFPSLFNSYDEWSGVYTQILFLDAPKRDQGFRYLRQFLLDKKFVALQRGTYLKPGELDDESKITLKKLYWGHVVVFELKKWLIGDERQFLNDSYLLQDIANSLSGISSELNQLLDKKNKSLNANHQLKSRFLSVFDRYTTILDQDLGLVPYFYPQSKNSIDVLDQIKALGERIIDLG